MCFLFSFSFFFSISFFEFELPSRGATMLVRSFPMKSTKRLAPDVFDAFATHSGLVYDVCWAQNDSTRGRVDV